MRIIFYPCGPKSYRYRNVCCSCRCRRSPADPPYLTRCFEPLVVMLFPGLFLRLTPPSILTSQPCRFAARKGTRIKRQLENRKRARARAAAAKLEPPKKWIPASMKMKLDPANIVPGGHFLQETLLKPLPPDNVFFTKGYVPIPMDVAEAVRILKETHAPDMLDKPDALVSAFMEIDMRTAKKTKFVSAFDGMIIDYKNNLNIKQKRTIAAVVPDLHEQERAAEAGASIIGSNDLIKDIQKGRVKVSDFDEIVVHTSMLIPLAPLRGILRDHFPAKTKGNYGPDIVPLIEKFLSGVTYQCKRDDFDPAYGTLELQFARLNMSLEEMIENLNTGLAHIEQTHRQSPDPKAADFAGFIRRVYLKCVSDSPERLLIKHWLMNPLEQAGYTDPSDIIHAKSAESDSLKSKKIVLLNVWNK